MELKQESNHIHDEVIASNPQKEHIFRSKLPDIYIPNHLPLHTYCFEKLSEFSDRKCVIDGTTGREWSYTEVEKTAKRVGMGFRNHFGVQKGSVIMLLLQNCPEFVFSFLGASFVGCISTTANPLCTPGEIEKQARASQARAVITQSAFADKVRAYCDENDIHLVLVDHPTINGVHDKYFWDLVGNESSDQPIIDIDIDISPEDVVALPYSSGTTGLPKGVMLTHKSLVTSVSQQVDGENPNLYFQSEDVILCVLPLFHIYSLNSVLLCALRVGSAILIMPKFEINMLMELVQKYKVTIAPFVPPIVLAIAKNQDMGKYDLSSVRTIMSGAAPMGKDLEDAVRAKLPNAKLGQGYGMTEAGPVLAMCLAFAKEPMEVKSGSCGTVVRNAELKIINPDTGSSLPRNHPGEICIRGDQIMKGYLNDPEATMNTIDKDGWLHTGDIGYVDDDDEIFIVDRIKELIKYKGFQVAPAELEAMLLNHPSINDAAVVAMKDDAAGEVVFYKRINRVFFVDSIPKLPSGKILRKELRARLANGITN
ncbi:hypothetical protein KSS87_002510 [Heliosperma pusillum]|nr:hypothetical protein KSS87_002510 [Heliosperma pusillum]